MALAALINRAGNAYRSDAPVYMTYRESTHVDGANRSEDINRAVQVRVADDFATMQDLPQGAHRTGPAFPVIPFFDPFSTFSFKYFANLHKINITFNPGVPYFFPMPAPDPSVNAVVPYISFWDPEFAPDSTPDALHFVIEPTARIPSGSFYPSDVAEDPTTQLPSHVTLQINGGDMAIGLDYGMVDGYWVITRGTWSSTQHVMGISFKVNAVTTFTDFTFPATPPNPQLAGTPRPSPSPSGKSKHPGV